MLFGPASDACAGQNSVVPLIGTHIFL